MKVLRRLLVVAGAAALALGGLVALAFNSGIQTWALRRALAETPGLRAKLGSVSAGIREVDLRDLEYRNGAAVLTVPRVVAGLPLLPAGLNRQVHVSKLEASGWTLDLTRVAPPAAAGSGGGAIAGSGQAAGMLPPAKEAVKAFAGVFAQLGLPVDLMLDGVALDGTVILPEGRGRVKVVVKGGGLAAGREGLFTVTATADLAAPEVSRVELTAKVTGAMDSPRTFARLGLALAAEATGTQFPAGAKLAADASAARTAGGESYSAAVVTGLRELLKLEAAFPPGGNRLEGTWRVDVREADVLPFVLGHPLPSFAVAGEGRLGADAAFGALRITGRIEAAAARLQVFAPELAALGDVTLVAQFDLTRREDAVFAERLEATLGAAQPVATVRALQPFEYRPAARELRVSQEDRAVLGVVLHALPVAWLQPWLGTTAVSGGAIRGELRVAAKPGGGVAVRTDSPVTLESVSVRSGARRWVEEIGFTAAGGADFSAAGWQVDLSRLELRRGQAKVASVVAKLGRLAGVAQATKSTGSIEIELAEVVRQPAAGGTWALAGGRAKIDYAASVGDTQQWVAKFDLADLAPAVEPAAGSAAPLPRITGDLRMDVGVGGRTEFRLPLTIRRNDRVSDVLAAGVLEVPKPGEVAVEAAITGERVVIDDVRVLGAVLADEKAGASATDSRRAPWAGVSGTVALNLKEVVWDDMITVRGLAGRMRLDAGTVKVEELQGGLGEKGRANLSGALSFEAGAEQPYALAADVALREIESGLLFKSTGPGRPVPLEGRFDLTSKVASRARRLGELAAAARGDVALSSRGGVFRGLPVAFSHPAETTGRLASIVASASSVFGGLAGRKDGGEIGNRAQAVAEVARALSPIAFDQLSVVVSRDAALNTTLRDFVLIAPELRLTGGGTALHRPGGSLLEDGLAMEFNLRARGRQGELLKYLGVLDSQADELGYLPCTVPLRIAGSVARPDASEINVKLAALALERAGVAEKASELFNRVFGGGK